MVVFSLATESLCPGYRPDIRSVLVILLFLSHGNVSGIYPYIMYHDIFVVGPNKHDILLIVSLSLKFQQIPSLYRLQIHGRIKGQVPKGLRAHNIDTPGVQNSF